MIAVPPPWAQRFLRPLTLPADLPPAVWSALLLEVPVFWLFWLPTWGQA